MLLGLMNIPKPHSRWVAEPGFKPRGGFPTCLQYPKASVLMPVTASAGQSLVGLGEPQEGPSMCMYLFIKRLWLGCNLTLSHRPGGRHPCLRLCTNSLHVYSEVG